MPITVESWMEVKPLVAPEMRGIIDICIEMEEHLEHIRRIESAWINGEDVALFMDYAQRLIDHYLEYVNGVPDLTDETKKMLINDANVTFSIFKDRDGSWKDLGIIFSKHVEDGTMEMFFPTYIEPIVAFTHSRIYDSLITYLRIIEKEFSGKMALIIVKKCGLHQVPEREDVRNEANEADEAEED